jgi:hypothetical protein
MHLMIKHHSLARKGLNLHPEESSLGKFPSFTEKGFGIQLFSGTAKWLSLNRWRKPSELL